MRKAFEKDFIKDLNKLLNSLKIKKGDIVMLHLDSKFIGQYFPKNREEAFRIFFLEVLNKIGKSGTLIVPTFSMSYTENKPYDITNSKSELGPLSEYFRLNMGAKRTMDPIYSFSVLGKHSDLLSQNISKSCFGDDSIFSFCFKMKAKLLFMGCSLDRATFVHFVEEKIGVNYRYFKEFSGETIFPNNSKRNTQISLYVRKLNIDSNPNHDELKKSLTKSNLLNFSTLNRVKCMSVKMKDFFNISAKLLSMNEYSLINEKI
tara:strand:- start:9970 stop:10752 length:783 start_codon:yes stop_codon:yes gene_type:complete